MGSKWRLAKQYGPPQTDLVIEPFAGAACYSLFWNVPKAILYDLNPVIAGIWSYLIRAKESEIQSLPIDFETVDELVEIPQEARWLIGFWITKGNTRPNKSRSAWAREYRNSGDCKVWGEAVRVRLASQVSKIRNWEVYCSDYRNSPNVTADWFIDPPYCENKGATWLPFVTFAEARAMKINKPSIEVIYQQRTP